MKQMTNYKKAGYLLLTVTGLFLAAQFIVPLLSDGSDLTQLYAVNALIVSIGAIYAPTLFMMRRSEPASFGRTRVSATAILWSILLGLGLFQLVTGLSTAFGEGLSALGIQPMNVSAELPPTDGWRFLAAVVLIAVIPALAEEQFFRGALLQSWRAMGRRKSILLTALLFGLFHLSPFDLPFTFGIGAVLGVLSYDSESVYPAMAVHGVNNFMAVLLTHAARQAASSSAAVSEQSAAQSLWFSIAVYVLVGGFITAISLKQVRRNIVMRPAPAGERDKGARLPAILAAAVLILLNFLMLAIQMRWLAL